ncbi:MAG: hypothetical protein HQL91_02560 [Magnetococcales bacterium]|nr:hypothetical protein [Magnetococcales bacterium]
MFTHFPLRQTILATALLLLTGCAMDSLTTPAPGAQPQQEQEAKVPAPKGNKGTPPAVAPTPVPPPPSHPSSVNPEKFVGATGQELLKQFGPPNLTTAVTLPDRAAAEGFLYYPKDHKGCIHTFVVLEQNNKVVRYFCQ